MDDMDDIDGRDFGRLEAEVESLSKRIDSLDRQVASLGKKMDEMLELAARWKGAFWAGIGIISFASGVVGWLMHWWVK